MSQFVCDYFCKIREDLKAFLNEKRSSAKQPLSPSEPKLSSICNAYRIGWKITSHEKVTKSQIENIKKDMNSNNGQSFRKESVLEHMYHSYLIGLLYLPSNQQENNITRNNRAYREYDKQRVLSMILIHDIGESEVGDVPTDYEKYKETLEMENKFNKSLYMSGTYENIADLSKYHDLWLEWHSESTNDINIILAKELDVIQMLYKYHELLLDKKINFSEKRTENFLKTKDAIKTSLGKNIYKIVIDDNPKFVNLQKSDIAR